MARKIPYDENSDSVCCCLCDSDFDWWTLHPGWRFCLRPRGSCRVRPWWNFHPTLDHPLDGVQAGYDTFSGHDGGGICGRHWMEFPRFCRSGWNLPIGSGNGGGIHRSLCHESNSNTRSLFSWEVQLAGWKEIGGHWFRDWIGILRGGSGLSCLCARFLRFNGRSR